jgi:hydroxymethylglutaryl-CoA lyase
MTRIHITETARDAMQGIKPFIPTQTKVEYVNALLKAGFDTVDAGSFVSPKAIPQMADTMEVLRQIELPANPPELMVLVVNQRGVEQAAKCHRINSLSYPFSISPTFLKRNLNSDEKGSLQIIKQIVEAAQRRNFEVVIYLSMALGNPYGDDWSEKMVVDGAARLYELGIRRMPLSDILGNATPQRIYSVYEQLIPAFPDADFGLHLHTKASDSYIKLEAAWDAGVRSYETVLNGLGGCPTAADEMVGNLSTQNLLHFCEQKGIPNKINRNALNDAVSIASRLL